METGFQVSSKGHLRFDFKFDVYKSDLLENRSQIIFLVQLGADIPTQKLYILNHNHHKSIPMTEDNTIRRKRLLHRSRYTGMKETDLMLGRFANKYINSFSDEELNIYEELLKAGDPSIYAWAVGREEVPEEYMTTVMEKLINFAIYEHDPATVENNDQA